MTNIGFEGVDSEALIMGLSNPEDDSPIVTLSNGSACTAAKIEPSHVLLAIGLPEDKAYNSIRFSLGYKITYLEITEAKSLIKKTITSLRLISS